MVLSPGLEVEGAKVKQLVVEEATDPEPVVFYVVGHQPGVMDLQIDFRQDGQPIASVPLAVEICAAEEPEEQVRIPPSALAPGGPYAPPADLDFRVTLREDDGHTRFHYVLHSANGAVDAWYQDVRGPRIVGSAESYQKKLLATLDRFAGSPASRDQPLTADQIRRRLQAVGERLCDELLPAELRRRLRTIHKSPIHTLQITSDEPWIPWELLKPEADDPADEAFWCERFELTRWLMGGHSPARELRIRRLACIEAAHAGEKALEGAVQDRRYLARLSGEAGVDDRSLEGATLEQVEELLDRGDVDLWHFAAPGSVDPSDADAAAIRLMQQRVLLPTDLDRRRQGRIAASRPLVFLNVGGAGQQSWALTGLAGWVRAWVLRGCCGVFVAPLGAVDDELAHLFSRTFYEALRHDQTVGQAILEARRAVKQQRPEDSTWLAYSVYAHPNARVVFSPRVDRVPRPTPSENGTSTRVSGSRPATAGPLREALAGARSNAGPCRTFSESR